MQSFKVLGAVLLTLAAAAGQAQILIGQTAGFIGTAAAGVKEITDGAKLYIDAIHAKGVAEVTPAMLEGFAAAKVLVEALRRAGLDFADLSIITADGKFRR
ncbi:MAG: hypothetical protein Q8R72_08190 [Hylemonella sp.]|nr:hypothetical protein [Hylemonella sp.]